MESNSNRKGAGQTALITGGSWGIGLELARLFARDGYDLILVARDQGELLAASEQMKAEGAGKVITISKDLFGENAAQELYDNIKGQGIQVDVLVNDAGQGVYGNFWETDLEQELKIIHLNINSLVVLTKRFLQEMIARGSGKILQLASVVSKAPAPLQAVYGGTKGFVYNFTQALHYELRDYENITITALQPGATDTDFFNKAGAEDSRMVVEDKLADPAGVAKEGYEALMAGKDKVVAGMKNKMQMAMGNLMPDQAIAAQMYNESKPADKEDAD